MNKLYGKRVIITGGSGGIGGAAVALFAAEGARVACTYNSTEPALPEGVIARRCNIADRAEVNVVFDAMVAELGGLDALIHAAGAHGSCPANEVDEAHWDSLFDLNGKGAVWTNQAAFRHLSAHGGSIVNMGSIEGVRGFAGNSIYSASRAAVMAWTRSIAQEWGRHAVRVNCVAPAIHTTIYQRQRDAMSQEALAAMDAALAQTIPLGGRLGEPLKDMAPALVFLAGDDSRFITGQVIAVDGGLMMLGS